MPAIVNTAFIKKPIMAFNNVPFSEQTIAPMHETYERLMLAARELRDVTMPAAVARLLNVSLQVMKNWEKRGLSEGGALMAQRSIGCDANWILGHVDAMTSHAWKPAPTPTKVIAAERVTEFPAHRWPFATFSAEEFLSLDEERRTQIEDQILGSITRARLSRERLSKAG